MSISSIVIIPTYDNPKTIKQVAFDVIENGYKLIIIDDGSAISVESLFTQDELKNIIIVKHSTNQGKGQAIITGTQKARELGYTHVVSIDGDGQHLASQIQYLLELNPADDIIIGARNFEIMNIPNGSKFGRWFSNFWACWDTGFEITDSLSGFRIYPISILDLDIKTTRFDWEMEVLVRHADAGKKIEEVVIECYYPTAEERVSHFRKFSDTMAIVWVHIQILPFKWPRFIWGKITNCKK